MPTVNTTLAPQGNNGEDLSRKEYRKIDDQIYSTFELQTVTGTISYTDKGVLILYCHYGENGIGYGPKVALKNYSGVNGQKITVRAKKIGNYTWDQIPLELWDYGTKPNDAEVLEKIRQDELKAKQIEQIKLDREAAEAKAKAEAAVKAKARATSTALKSNQDAAAKGDPYGLMRMGERYRDGDGVEINLAKAREFLQKAADAGSITAKEELSELDAKQ